MYQSKMFSMVSGCKLDNSRWPPENFYLDSSGCCCLIGFNFVSLSTFKNVEIKENENTYLQI